MHAILFGRKIYALDMPSNFIFTHRRWLLTSDTMVSLVSAGVPYMSAGVALYECRGALYECRGGVLIFWHLFWCRLKKIFSKIILKMVLIIKL